MAAKQEVAPASFHEYVGWCRARESNPHDPYGSADFKSAASTVPPARQGHDSTSWHGTRIQSTLLPAGQLPVTLMAYCGEVIEDTVIPDQERRRKVIRVVQSLGLMIGGAYLLLAWTRFPGFAPGFVFPAISSVLALIAAGVVTSRARLAYWLFLAACLVLLLDLVNYVHALFFLGSFMILAALAAINEPDDQEAVSIRRIMEQD